MFRNKKTPHLRSALKALCWRLIAFIDTVLVVLVVTCFFGACNLNDALKIGASEFLLKLAIYYFHERIWLKILKKQASTNKEVLYKTISWRIIATVTTFIISGVILNGFNQIAFYIAFIELFTKFVLYYIHEKLWLKLPLGKILNFILRRS